MLAVIIWRLRRRPDLLARRLRDMPPPDTLVPGTAIVVGPRRAEKWITFACPCGCGVPYLLSLSQKRRPRWTICTDWLSRPTIAPSVRRLGGCRSHFWVKDGAIHWCHDTGKEIDASAEDI